MSKILKVEGLQKTFVEGKITTPVLQGINLEVEAGETIAILGASGSGKTTLLQILGGLQDFDAGEVTFENHAYSTLQDEAMTALRERHFGFVYQFHHLLQELSALENVMIPLMIRKISKADAILQATHVLDQVGLSHRLRHKPGELSGGERQRVALARALVKKPQVLLADEPTGNLDRQSSAKVMEVMLRMSQELHITLIFITHDESLARHASRILSMQDGVFVDH